MYDLRMTDVEALSSLPVLYLFGLSSTSVSARESASTDVGVVSPLSSRGALARGTESKFSILCFFGGDTGEHFGRSSHRSMIFEFHGSMLVLEILELSNVT